MKPKSKITLIIIHSFIPVLIGAFIYICYRKTSLLLFDWLDKISMSEFVIYIRKYVNPENILHSNWFTHNLPDALWVYAYTSFFIILYSFIVNKRTIFIFLIPLLIAITSEFLQLTNIVPGTFDIFDIFAYLGSSLLSMLILINYKLKKYNYE